MKCHRISKHLTVILLIGHFTKGSSFQEEGTKIDRNDRHTKVPKQPKIWGLLLQMSKLFIFYTERFQFSKNIVVSVAPSPPR